MLRSLMATSSANRLEIMNGREFIVVPVVALTEGVYQCAACPTPELYLAEEFGGTVEAWNGRPITINHPSEGDTKVPAGTPEFFENSIGFIFNAVLEDKKLKVEAWIDIEKAQNHSDDSRDILNRLRTAQPVEISTGYFAKLEHESGEFDGKVFNAIQRNIIPDHLAFLAHGIKGACNWADGCGAPRVNEGEKNVTCNCEQPKLNEEGVCETCTNIIKNTNTFSKAFKKLKDLTFKFKGHSEHDESDMDTRRALEAALSGEFQFAFVVAIFEKDFVFENEGALWRREFDIANDGSITLGEDLDKVRAITDFVPVKVNQEDGSMTKEDLIKSLIGNEAVAFGEDDRSWLEDQDEETLAKLVPIKANEETPEEKKLRENKEIDEKKELEEKKLKDNKGSDDDEPQTTEQFIASAPPEMQQVLNSGLEMHRKKKQRLIEALVANDRCDFTSEDLEDREISELEKLAKIANLGDFSGQGLKVVTNLENDDSPPKAPVAFPLEKKEA